MKDEKNELRRKFEDLLGTEMIKCDIRVSDYTAKLKEEDPNVVAAHNPDILSKLYDVIWKFIEDNFVERSLLSEFQLRRLEKVAYVSKLSQIKRKDEAEYRLNKKNEIKELREEGNSLREIGKIMGMSHERVRLILKDLEVK